MSMQLVRCTIKMKYIITFVALGISTSKAQYENSGKQYENIVPFKTDYQVNPNSNIYFSFEQLRNNQPSQIDERVENAGQYMYRKRTTTHNPTSITTEKSRLEKIPLQTTKWVENNNVEYSTPSSRFFGNLPNAPALNNIAQDQINDIVSQATARIPHLNSNRNKPATNTRNVLPQKFEVPIQVIDEPQRNKAILRSREVSSDVNRNEGYPSYRASPAPNVPLLPFYETSSMTPVPSMYRASEMPLWSPNHRVPKHYRPTINRGSHKFNSFDNVYTDPQNFLQTTTTPASVGLQRGPPPAVPTLTPWQDGF